MRSNTHTKRFGETRLLCLLLFFSRSIIQQQHLSITFIAMSDSSSETDKKLVHLASGVAHLGLSSQQRESSIKPW